MNRHIPDVNQLYAGFVLSGYVCFREIMPCPPEQHNFVACTITNRAGEADKINGELI